LYYLWAIGSAVIAHGRIHQRNRRRIVVLVLAIVAMTIVSSYSGCRPGVHVAMMLK